MNFPSKDSIYILCYIELCLGEIHSNAAFWFTTFGKVNTDMISDPKTVFECRLEKVGTWTYPERLKDVERLGAFRKQQKHVPWNKCLEFLRKIGSRQIRSPPIGSFVERSTICTLHCANLCVEHEWRNVLRTLLWLLKASEQSKPYNMIDPAEPLKRFLNALSKAKARQIYEKSLNYITGTCEQFRFMGRCTKFVLRIFAQLCTSFIDTVADREDVLIRLFAHILTFKLLRQIFSLASRLKITEDEIAELDIFCTHYYTAIALFSNPFPTAWLVGNALTAHAKCVTSELGFGLGVASLQGPEHLNVYLHCYAEHTDKKTIWSAILRHDEVHKRILLEKATTKDLLKMWNWEKKSILLGEGYVAPQCEDGFCPCGSLHKIGACTFCDHTLFREVLTAIQEKKLSPRLKKLVCSYAPSAKKVTKIRLQEQAGSDL